MPKRKLSPETIAIIGAIENATGAAAIVADRVAGELKEHTKHDDERFAALTTLVESMAHDVKSLLDSRTFIRGAWWALMGVVGGVWAVIHLAWNYLRGH